eukprot:3229295-Amphidinium_carterae.2
MCLLSLGRAALSRSWQVSTHGRVCNPAGYISFGSRQGSGSLTVRIDGKNRLVHRLIAFAHLQVPPSACHELVVHVDGDPTNNHVSNLRYARRGDTQRRMLGRLGKVVCSRGPGEHQWTRHVSTSAAALARCVSDYTVRSHCANNGKTRAGVEFKYPAYPDLRGEEWKPAVNPFTDAVVPATMVSSRGRVKRADGTYTWGSLTSGGYLQVQVAYTTFLVHRLVLRTFSSSAPKHTWEANHIDRNKENNCVQNLEYVTHAENMAHHYKTRSRTGALVSKLRKPILGRPLHGAESEWRRFDSHAAAAAFVGCVSSNVTRMLQGRTKSAKGWELKHVLQDSTVEGEVWADVQVGLRKS